MNEIKTKFDEELEQPEEKQTEARPRPFLVWKVGDKEYRLKLTTAVESKLESQFEMPLLNAVLDDGIPKQEVIVSIIQGAMLKFNHGMTSLDVTELLDDYKDEGHTSMDILKEVIYPLLYDAGFFTKAMLDSMLETLNEVDTQL